MPGVKRIAHPCGCKQETFIGQKRPKTCEEHGNLFVKPQGNKQLVRRSLKRSEPKRNWTDARAKVELEGRCRVCGIEEERASIAAAHSIGRKHDQPARLGTKTLYVNPLDIVPLCVTCHLAYDDHELDLLPYLAPEEQVRAVEVAGSIEAARRRLCPSAYLEAAT